MVNPNELITKSAAAKERATMVLYGQDNDGSMKEEAMMTEGSNNGAARKIQRMFRRNSLIEKAQLKHNNKSKGEVYLPILIIPGIASSGLYVEESSLDNDKYKNLRVWMNASFLAKSRFQNKILNLEDIERSKNNAIIKLRQSQQQKGSVATATAVVKEAGAVSGAMISGVVTGVTTKTKGAAASAFTKGVAAAAWLHTETSSSSSSPSMDNNNNNDNETDNDDGRITDEINRCNSHGFAKEEEELEIKNAWIHHISLDTNMIDEKPGNKIRAYEGMKGCEYLVDGKIAESQGWVWAPMIKYATEIMGYEREKSIDAAPYDWRLAPSVTETRDGYLTKTMIRVERMYKENQNLPIILCCHSMGCKMGHYFLNFAKQQKGQNWLDKYIHTYMPVAAPHGGVALSIRTGATGSGLNDVVDTLVGNPGDGLTMYRSWSSGNWLMPRYLPPNVFPSVIVRREGELGLTLTSEIEVGSLFALREKPPKELRLTVQFRGRIRAHSDYHRVIVNKSNPGSMTVSFQETFYLAVPSYLGEDDDEIIGELVFYLEEPAGRINQNATELGKRFRKATGFMRGFKKKASAFYRDVAKKWGTVLRVACNEQSMIMRVSDFGGKIASVTGKKHLEINIAIVAMIGGTHSEEIIVEDSDSDDDCGDDADEDGNKSRSGIAFTKLTESHYGDSIGCISLKISYCPPPKPSTEPTSTPIAITNEDTPNPPIICKRNRLNTVSCERVKYDVWSGTDLFKNDGFVNNMFGMVEEYYEGDPLGPITKSVLDPPPVNCVRSIYGINVPTEVGAIYRKVPVVTVGDNVADSRYMLDKSARFPPATTLLYDNPDDSWSKTNLLTYKVTDGIVTETPKTLQNIPGKKEQRAVCGDGTVPYWNMVHALTWKNDIDELTVDELDGAVHRDIIGDERFFALLKRYCRVIDPRANAMMMMKSKYTLSSGIGGLSDMSLGSNPSNSDISS